MKIRFVHLDFETFSRYPIKYGSFRYAMDPSTEVLIIGYAIGDESIRIIDFARGDSAQEFVELLKDPGVIFWAHNAVFECNIIEYVGPRYGWPIVPIERFRCTATLARAARYPGSLDKVSKALGLIDKKDPRGTALINRFSVPVKPTKNHPTDRWYPDEDRERWESFKKYCEQDVRVERVIHRTLKWFDLSPYEQEVYNFTYKLNQRGIKIDIPAVKAAIQLNKEFEKRQATIFRGITGLNPAQVTELAAWANMDSVAKPMIEALLEDEPPGTPRRKALEIRLSLSKTSNKKLDPMLKAVGEDERFRGGLVYYGAAATGRFAGSVIQPHNYPRPAFKESKQMAEDIKWMSVEDVGIIYGDVPEVTSSCLRHMLRADKGKTLIISDFAGVEARGVLWFCEELRAVQMFDEGVDIYKDMASFIYQIPLDEIGKDERFVGKQTILGCGYGMGWRKFQMSCANYGENIGEPTCRKAVTGYREMYPQVKQMWNQLGYMFASCVQTHKSFQFNKGCVMYMKDHYLIIELPSGRRLVYPHAGVRRVMAEYEGHQWETNEISFMTEASQTKKWKRHAVHGGFLLENIIQAICRDLLVSSMFNVEKAGFPVILTVHDEVVCEIPEMVIHENTIKEFDWLMIRKPEWAAGFPLAVETEVSKVYQK